MRIIFLLCLLVVSSRCNDFCNIKCICHPKVLSCKGLVQDDIASDKFQNTIDINLETVESIHITDGTLPNLPKNLFGSCAGDSSSRLSKLKKLDLQDNDIHTIDGQTLHCVPHLEEINLANNQWNISRNHTHVFTSVPNLKKLNLSNAFHNQVDSKVHLASLQMVILENNMDNLEVLALDNNKFSVFDKNATENICAMPKLRRLNLSYNLLPKLTIYHIRCAQNLEYLDLSYNSIITFEDYTHNGLLYSLDYIQSTSENLTVNFYGNEFDCDCGLLEFHNWLKRTKVHVIKKEKLTCHDGLMFNRTVFSLQSTDFKCLTINSSEASNKAVVGVLVTMFVIIALVLIVVAYVKRNAIKHFASTFSFGDFKKKSMARQHLVGYSSVNNENATDIEV